MHCVDEFTGEEKEVKRSLNYLIKPKNICMITCRDKNVKRINIRVDL